MKINPMQSVQAYRKLQETQQQEKQDKPQKSDEVQISKEAKAMMEKSTTYSAERAEKVQEIKAQIENGTYKVNAQETAKKFYEFWD
ncbi:flagellar biosynthesis anti-sigma factor FlgM [Salisediminibacterium beveridgei]|uniref:Negative regulator of flagellin synthesis n=1 Tax=Salisediminibacterium beveridgei TaxID=632773 RepID=A0A1D7QSC2_9BACI|nr:flagellar biosynthesis anti-sigma factor FlgM [Salisediminibacterium beveridgei]AOM81898.1 Anti-Sigma-28 Factor FlgM Family Protein [Salisediminibacterium beveridgei]